MNNWRMKNYTLDQLAALDAIARTGTFAAAAAELHRVPSAVTYLIRGLESALDIALFDRTGRRAVLTKGGHQILQAARGVLEQARVLERVAVDLAGGWEVELHVVVDGALPMSPLTDCLRRFADAAIPTNLRVDVEYQEGVVDRFHGAPADIGMFIGFQGNGDELGYDTTALPALGMVLVASPDHPTTRGPLTDTLRGRHAELVTRDSSPQYSQRTKPSFMGSPNVVFLPDFHSKRIALVAAAGYGWIPKHLVEDDLASGALQLLDTKPNQWTYHPQLVTREGVPLGRGGQLFVDALKASLETPTTL